MPRRWRSTNGSSSTSQASWYITASAWGHGSIQAWQVQVEESSLPKGSSSTPASSACSTRVWGRSPASRAATRPASAATVSTSASRAAGSSTGTEPSTAQSPCSSSTAATNRPGSTLIWPIRPDRESARAVDRSAEVYDDSSTARTQAFAHHRVARAAPLRAGVRGWTIVVTSRRPSPRGGRPGGAG